MQSRLSAEPCPVIFNSINVARLPPVSRCVVNGRRDGFEYAHAKCRDLCARGTRGGSLSSRAIDPFVWLAREPAAINKGRRDEQSGTTVAMSHGMHRLLSNGCRDEDDDHDDDDDDDDDGDESLNAPGGTRADPSLDCIKAFPK
ncbi:Uncharacterized protein DBV15_11470 [Temnothorax longispinosus]|uniref:Uncharacterized protein n=1 Tax=Temnothorax longispinosus TaxID=300112 RepID=A0A4S2KEM1_9HYME|nr:Uncharacterized protein DBV15_11470 [Temnothorax longispinosus]